MVIRFTPNGSDVAAWVAAISASSNAGPMDPQASTPKPPALLMAATSVCSLTQLMAPPMMAVRVPRKARPRAHRRSSRARAASRLGPRLAGASKSAVSGI